MGSALGQLQTNPLTQSEVRSLGLRSLATTKAKIAAGTADFLSKTVVARKRPRVIFERTSQRSQKLVDLKRLEREILAGRNLGTSFLA